MLTDRETTARLRWARGVDFDALCGLTKADDSRKVTL